MCFPNIDQYIATFEELARQASYTIGNGETIVTDGPDQESRQVHEVHEASTRYGPYMAKWSSWAHIVAHTP